ncbi:MULTISPECIES: hypothetical protein [unclassified Sulfuricurvum]|uniref:hypothetical protein n=1 Tax=unclassified Sulfuricurvum TaxID=2632390 RepID=UPI0025BF023E|nr:MULTISPECIES: hypothetical protein [unclassified Sulfuricurvum]
MNLAKIMTHTELQNELEPILKFSDNFREGQYLLVEFIETIIDKMYSTIAVLENTSDLQRERIANIKDDKTYLDRYMNAFKMSAEYYHSLGDIEKVHFMFQSYKVFEDFKKDSESILNVFSEINTFLLSTPDVAKNIRLLMRKRKLTQIQEEYIQRYNEYKNIQKIAKFFEGYNVTRKVIITSASIYLYRTIYINMEVPKNTLKNVIESIFIRLGEQVNIYPNKMEGVYLKTIFKKLPIFAYPSKNEKIPFIDVDKISQILENRIEKSREKGKIGTSDQLQKYFEEISKSLLQGIKPSPTS